MYLINGPYREPTEINPFTSSVSLVSFSPFSSTTAVRSPPITSRFQIVNHMEGGESVLDTLFDEESVWDAHDVEMPDVEEGELIEQNSKTEVVENCDVDVNQVNQESNKRNPRHKKKKKKNKRKKDSGSGPNVTDINRFVLDTCKRLRERKSYLMWTAVGCLGVSALSDLVKEVDAIQACGGQKTADGKRFRNGGGILWNIIKVRDPNAYQEIMRKGKEFEKQFKQEVHNKQEPKQQGQASSQSVIPNIDQVSHNPPNVLEHKSIDQIQLEESSASKKRASVHDRIRIPVTYDDLVGGEDPKDDLDGL